MDVDVAGAADGHGLGHLRLQIVQIGDRGGGDIENVVRRGDAGQALAGAEDVAGGLSLSPASWRCARRVAWPRTAAPRYSCKPRCRSRYKGHHRCVRRCPTGSQSLCRWLTLRHPAPPCATTRTSVLPRIRIAAATPVATARALPNTEWSHGICHAVSGQGVVKTSRQPVALTATTLPRAPRIAASRAWRAQAGGIDRHHLAPAARIAASRAWRTPKASSQP